MRRAVAALAVAVTMLLAGAATASAHAELVGVDPLDGAMLTELPPQIVLTFSESVATPADVAVVGPDDQPLTAADPALVDTTATVTLDPGQTAADGWYTISYQVTSADGHLISGTTRFMLHGAGSTAMPDAPSTVGGTTSTEADPVVVGALVAGVAVALIVALAGLRRLLVGVSE